MILKLIKLMLLGFFLDNYTYSMNIILPNTLQKNTSAMVINTKTNKVIYEHLPKTPRLIASNMKLITTAVGLEQLHPDFKWHTKLFYKGSINNGILDGDLFILGGGDPTLDDRALSEIFANLGKIGVKKISGNLVIDNTIFNSLPTYSMLKVENYDIDTVLPDGLIVNANKTVFNIHVKANTVTIDSNLYGYNINNQLKIDPREHTCGDLSNQVYFNERTVTFSGKISPSCNQTLEFNMIDTRSYTKMALSRTLNNLSIELNGNIVYQNAPDKAILIYDYSSQSLEDAMVYMNHYSVNIIAETIFLSLGAFTTNNENTYKNSQDVYYSFMKRLNMLNPNFRLENGAGLSRTESVTAAGMANLLKYENNSQYAAIFEKTLPQSGLDGSLKNNFTKFGDRVKFKTGTLNDTHAYSGYFLSRRGIKYIVVAIANNINTNSRPQMNRFNSLITKLLDKLDKN